MANCCLSGPTGVWPDEGDLNVGNRETVIGIYEAFGRGDVPWILDRLDDDVEWEPGIRDTGLPYLRLAVARPMWGTSSAT